MGFEGTCRRPAAVHSLRAWPWQKCDRVRRFADGAGTGRVKGSGSRYDAVRTNRYVYVSCQGLWMHPMAQVQVEIDHARRALTMAVTQCMVQTPTGLHSVWCAVDEPGAARPGASHTLLSHGPPADSVCAGQADHACVSTGPRARLCQTGLPVEALAPNRPPSEGEGQRARHCQSAPRFCAEC